MVIRNSLDRGRTYGTVTNDIEDGKCRDTDDYDDHDDNDDHNDDDDDNYDDDDVSD